MNLMFPGMVELELHASNPILYMATCKLCDAREVWNFWLMGKEMPDQRRHGQHKCSLELRRKVKHPEGMEWNTDLANGILFIGKTFPMVLTGILIYLATGEYQFPSKVLHMKTSFEGITKLLRERKHSQQELLAHRLKNGFGEFLEFPFTGKPELAKLYEDLKSDWPLKNLPYLECAAVEQIIKGNQTCQNVVIPVIMSPDSSEDGDVEMEPEEPGTPVDQFLKNTTPGTINEPKGKERMPPADWDVYDAYDDYMEWSDYESEEDYRGSRFSRYRKPSSGKPVPPQGKRVPLANQYIYDEDCEIDALVWKNFGDELQTLGKVWLQLPNEIEHCVFNRMLYDYDKEPVMCKKLNGTTLWTPFGWEVQNEPGWFREASKPAVAIKPLLDCIPSRIWYPYRMEDIKMVLQKLSQYEERMLEDQVIQYLRQGMVVLAFLDMEEIDQPLRTQNGKIAWESETVVQKVSEPGEIALLMYNAFHSPEEWKGGCEDNDATHEWNLKDFFQRDVNAYHWVTRPRFTPEELKFKPMVQTVTRHCSKCKTQMHNFYNIHANPFKPEGEFTLPVGNNEMAWQERRHRDGKEYERTFPLWSTVRNMLKTILESAVQQSGVEVSKCCIAVKGGGEEKFLQELGWKGMVLDLNFLRCPNYDRQPAILLSAFRQCGKNFHVNMSENGEFRKQD